MANEGTPAASAGSGISAIPSSPGPVPRGALNAVVAAAQRAPAAIAKEGATQNALMRAQAARDSASARGSGVAVGGGLGAASGTLGMRAQREAAAQAAQTARDVQGAKLQASEVALQAETTLAGVAADQVAEASRIAEEMAVMDKELMASGFDQDSRLPYINQAIGKAQSTLPQGLAERTILNMLEFWATSGGGFSWATKAGVELVWRAYGLAAAQEMRQQTNWDQLLRNANLVLAGNPGGQIKNEDMGDLYGVEHPRHAAS